SRKVLRQPLDLLGKPLGVSASNRCWLTRDLGRQHRNQAALLRMIPMRLTEVGVHHRSNLLPTGSSRDSGCPLLRDFIEHPFHGRRDQVILAAKMSVKAAVRET